MLDDWKSNEDLKYGRAKSAVPGFAWTWDKTAR
jgi:hypothetical protein